MVLPCIVFVPSLLYGEFVLSLLHSEAQTAGKVFQENNMRAMKNERLSRRLMMGHSNRGPSTEHHAGSPPAQTSKVAENPKAA
jgi:hypothetical protein